MKKLYTVLGMALLSGTVSAQTYLDQDFETSLTNGGWTTQILTDTTDWFQGVGTGNSYAKISNYNGSSNVAAESWLISPAFDISGATTPILSFSTVMKWPGPALQLMISTDYDGTSNPMSQGTWIDITSMAAWDTDDAAWGSFSANPSGDISLSSYITSGASTYIAYVYTGTASNGSTWEIDDVLVNETGATGGGGTGTGTAVAHSIFEIQNSTGDSPYKDSLVSTGGIVTYVRDNGAFYIGSGTGEFSGVYVYETGQTVAIGDSVTFDALVDEFYDLTELKNVANFVNVSSGNFFMSTAVTTVEAGTEAYEGVLVSTCGEAMTTEDQYQEYELNDGSGVVFVDNYSNGYHPTGTNFTPPTVGMNYTVKGIVDYAYGAFKILPRTLADVAVTSQCVVAINENEVAFNVYPNPVNTELNIDVEGYNTISILDLNGKTLKTITSNGFTTVDVSDLASGIYMVRINNTIKRIAVK